MIVRETRRESGWLPNSRIPSPSSSSSSSDSSDSDSESSSLNDPSESSAVSSSSSSSASPASDSALTDAASTSSLGAPYRLSSMCTGISLSFSSALTSKRTVSGSKGARSSSSLNVARSSSWSEWSDGANSPSSASPAPRSKPAHDAASSSLSGLADAPAPRGVRGRGLDPPLAPDVDGLAPPVGLPRCGAGSGAGSGLTTAAPPATCFLSSAGGGAGPATNASGRLDCRPLLRGVTASASPPSFPPLAPAEALPPLDCLSATDGGGAGPASNLRGWRAIGDRRSVSTLFPIWIEWDAFGRRGAMKGGRRLVRGGASKDEKAAQANNKRFLSRVSRAASIGARAGLDARVHVPRRLRPRSLWPPGGTGHPPDCPVHLPRVS